MTWPVVTSHVRTWLGDDANADEAALQLAVDAVTAYVPGLPSMAGHVTDEAGFDPPGDVFLGAVMLAARWFQRRGSVLGTSASYSDFGTTTILRHDPDIARLLRIGHHAGFTFGAPAVEDTTTDAGLVWATGDWP